MNILVRTSGIFVSLLAVSLLAARFSTDCATERCVVNGDGSTTVADVTKLLRAAAGVSLTLAGSVPPRFIDNGDGTITDDQTGLQWEKKTGTVRCPDNCVDCSLTDCPDPHDVNNEYQRCLDTDEDNYCDKAGHPMDGNAFTDFLAKLNTPPSCFARHCDWRLPTVGLDGGRAELETIVDLNVPGCPYGGPPCIDPVFGPTKAEDYMANFSDSDGEAGGEGLWVVEFDSGHITNDNESDGVYVRAVRGGKTTTPICGDADGNGQVTVTDGVNVLRAAAGLSGDCPQARCDVDGNGQITVTDGVNVLRLAAGLPVELRCAF